MTPDVAVFVGGFLLFLVFRGSGRSSRRRSKRSPEVVSRVVEALVFLTGLALVLYGASSFAQIHLELTL